MTRITVVQPAPVPVPRGAEWAASLFATLLGWGRRSRVASTDRRQTRNREADAAELRRYAQEMMRADPRFAADLFAAADRHETQE